MNMARRKKSKKDNGKRQARFEEKKPSRFALPEQTKRLILLVFMILAAVIVTLSFFDLAGMGGEYFKRIAIFLLGKTVFILPLFLIVGGFAFWRLRYKNRWPVILAISLLVLGTSAIFECLDQETRRGGWVGYLASLPFLRTFGLLATQIIFSSIVLIGIAIIWQLLQKPKLPLTKVSAGDEEMCQNQFCKAPDQPADHQRPDRAVEIRTGDHRRQPDDLACQIDRDHPAVVEGREGGSRQAHGRQNVCRAITCQFRLCALTGCRALVILLCVSHHTKTEPMSVRVPATALLAVDAFAQRCGIKRSAAIRDLLVSALQQHGLWPPREKE